MSDNTAAESIEFEQIFGDAQDYRLELEDGNGSPYHGRIRGWLIAEGSDKEMYATADGRVILYDRMSHWEEDDLENALRNNFDQEEYVSAMLTLGLTPVVDL